MQSDVEALKEYVNAEIYAGRATSPEEVGNGYEIALAQIRDWEFILKSREPGRYIEASIDQLLTAANELKRILDKVREEDQRMVTNDRAWNAYKAGYEAALSAIDRLSSDDADNHEQDRVVIA